jgi:hypothetical protein
MCFCLAKTFARGVEGDGLWLDQSREVGKPSLGARHVVADDNKESPMDVFREGGDHDGVARPVQSANLEPGARGRQNARQSSEFL